MKHDELKDFLIIQEQDTHITRLKKELSSLPELKEKILKRLNMAKAKTEDSKKEIIRVEQSIQEAEHNTESKKQYLSKLKIQQGETRNNDEYQRFIQEIAKTEQAIDELDTQTLELMEELDEEKQIYSVVRQKLTTIERDVEEELARFEHTAEQDKKRLQEMIDRRNSYISKIDPDNLDLYERMVKSKGLPVIVAMSEEGQCTGCYMALTQAAKSKVIAAGGEVVTCSNCGRFLY